MRRPAPWRGDADCADSVLPAWVCEWRVLRGSGGMVRVLAWLVSAALRRDAELVDGYWRRRVHPPRRTIQTASSTKSQARRTSGPDFAGVTRAVPHSTSLLALMSSRKAFSAEPAAARLPRAVRSSLAAAAWSLTFRLAPIRVVTIASLALMPAWMASYR